MPSTRSLILLSLATTLDLLFLTLLLWALATHKGAKVCVWWVIALALVLLAQGIFCKSPSHTGLIQGANKSDSHHEVVLESQHS
ncbi:hypothetical protein VTO58DRAFT_108383 [Aureobasidium pullulans]